MAAPLLHEGVTVVCAHGGRAEPVETSSRVLASGRPVVVQSKRYVVAGCTFAGAPCATGSFVSASQRIRAGGSPVVLADSPSVTAPSGAPLTVSRGRARVFGV